MAGEKVRFTAACAFCEVVYSGGFIPGSVCTIGCQCRAVGWVTANPDEVRLELWQKVMGRQWPAGTPADRAALAAEVAYRERGFETSDLRPEEMRAPGWKVLWARRRPTGAA